MAIIKKQQFNLDTYVKELAGEYPNIKAVWLFGSRANNSYHEDSDWDLLVFGDIDLLNQFKNDILIKRDNVDLLINYDGNNFVSSWARNDKEVFKKGNLEEWKWILIAEREAQYEVDAGLRDVPEADEPVLYTPRKEILKAIRIWPE